MIILSIPFLNKKFITKQVTEYRDKFEWLEFRLDFHSDFEKFPQNLINQETIITIRDASKEGKYPSSFSNKISFYKEMISKYNCLVDCEIELYKRQFLPASNLILSYHDFAEKIDNKKLEYFINISNSIPSKYLKIAVNISNYSDFSKMKLLISNSNKPILFVGMGKLGKISRWLYPFSGSIGTYVGLSEFPTAKGQITIAESEKFNLKNININSKIGGIIGGKQVEKSLGLKFYNRYFRKKNFNAVYLPFIVEDLNDFWNWFEWSKKRCEFYGLTFTMPFKTIIAKKLQYRLPTANLYLPTKNEIFNTDATAFQKSVQYLKIKSSDKILIFGSGSTTETALFSLAKFKNIIISGRNTKIGKLLSSKYNNKFISLQNAINLTFDLIINCTPIGMNNEHFFESTNLQFPMKIIDLPYSDKKTPLIQKCEEEKIPFVDGKMFWKWQAEIQLEKFSKIFNKRES
ncbi:MAG: type I 3-dehydroquinate dehydratase [Armatimonadetes bacterium]|nr:type I 3-dehydroquinate dehydratase [Armatimonadota bacterium]